MGEPSSNKSLSFVYADLVTPIGSSELDWVRRFVIADTYARFLREQGDSVLFAPAIGAFGEQIEVEAERRGVSPNELVDSQVKRLRKLCELFEVSCDWKRSVVTSQPELCRRTQRIFLELFEKDLVYRSELPAAEGNNRPWFFRRASFAESCHRSLAQLPGWTEDAIEAQRETLGRVEGVEIDAVLFGGGQVPVFTPYPDAIGDATFIAISPHHPQVEDVASSSDLEQLRNDPGPVKMAQTAMQAAVPGIDGLLPVVVTPSVDARFGPTIYLGIPERDDADREIAARLVAASAPGFRTVATSSKSRQAARFRLPDQPVSRIGAWGIPVPIVDCEGCGPVPAQVEEVPADACPCPQCGAAAKPDPQVIDGRFDCMWAWLALDGWLPARRVVWSTPDGEQLLDERIAAKAASELGALPGLDPPEPFAGATPCGAVGGEDGALGIDELEELAGEAGADVVRLTILHSASARKATSWTSASVRHSQRFLGELREFAEPRLSSRQAPPSLEIDGSTRLRRRLSAWCGAAEAKISANLERLEMHRATYDLMLLLKRIRNFEQRCANDGALDPLDRDAVVVALLRLVRSAAPCLPQTAAELATIWGESNGCSALTRAGADDTR